jgi:hypothetical protein
VVNLAEDGHFTGKSPGFHQTITSSSFISYGRKLHMEWSYSVRAAPPSWWPTRLHVAERSTMKGSSVWMAIGSMN